MRFQAAGQFTQGVADIDPVAAPETAIRGHILTFKGLREFELGALPAKFLLALTGVGVETLTLDFYSLIEDTGRQASIPGGVDRYISPDKRWVQFATGIVVTNGTFQEVTANLPGCGPVYARRTADTLTAATTRNLMAAWLK